MGTNQYPMGFDGIKSRLYGIIWDQIKTLWDQMGSNQDFMGLDGIKSKVYWNKWDGTALECREIIEFLRSNCIK